jgi:hypothetical protein
MWKNAYDLLKVDACDRKATICDDQPPEVYVNDKKTSYVGDAKIKLMFRVGTFLDSTREKCKKQEKSQNPKTNQNA